MYKSTGWVGGGKLTFDFAMLCKAIPGLRPNLTEMLHAKGWKAEIVLENEKSAEMDGREYLGYLGEFMAKANDVPARWVDRLMFKNSTVLWVYEQNDRDKLVGCLVFGLRRSLDAKVDGGDGPALCVEICHVAVMGGDKEFVEVGTLMVECLKCFLRCDARLSDKWFTTDRVLKPIVEQTRLPLVYIDEVELHKKAEQRLNEKSAEIMGLMSAVGFEKFGLNKKPEESLVGFEKPVRTWTRSMSAVVFEHWF